MAIASAPFTSDNDLEYVPFKQLVDALTRVVPSVVVLVSF